jgi:hypothetical protein
MKRYAFMSAEGIVVQLIVGALDESKLGRLLKDYRTLFGAESAVGVEDEATSVWIGGSYDSTSGVFSPPPSPEPEPEPIVEEPLNDDAPII